VIWAVRTFEHTFWDPIADNEAVQLAALSNLNIGICNDPNFDLSDSMTPWGFVIN
jgi:hypothetical protein